MSVLTHVGHGGGASAGAMLALTGMWLAMMSLMMAPTVWPWLQAFRRFEPHRSGAASAVTFVAGYLAAWLLYSIGAAAAQITLARAGTLDGDAGMSPFLAVVVLVVAGLVQFAPLTRACLSHCRNPLTYFLARWRNGPSNGLRIGFQHGLFCVGCCWALMATALAVGVMNLWWMVALSAAAFAEQVMPQGERIRIALGVALIVGGAIRFV